jgi:hypothetical protein
MGRFHVKKQNRTMVHRSSFGLRFVVAAKCARGKHPGGQLLSKLCARHGPDPRRRRQPQAGDGEVGHRCPGLSICRKAHADHSRKRKEAPPAKGGDRASWYGWLYRKCVVTTPYRSKAFIDSFLKILCNAIDQLDISSDELYWPITPHQIVPRPSLVGMIETRSRHF